RGDPDCHPGCQSACRRSESVRGAFAAGRRAADRVARCRARPGRAGSVRAMKAWRVTRYGSPRDVLALEDIEAPVPGDGEVLIRVSSITLNFNDLDGIHGRYKAVPVPVPYTPGMEVLGRVESAGAGAEEWLGKRVAAIPSGAHGGYAELVTAPVSMAFEMPDDMAESEAAGIFMPF